MIDPITFWLRVLGPFIMVSTSGTIFNRKHLAHGRALWFAKTDINDDPIALMVLHMSHIFYFLFGLSILATTLPIFSQSHSWLVIGAGTGLSLRGIVGLVFPKRQINYIRENSDKPDLFSSGIITILYPVYFVFGLYVTWLGWSPLFLTS